MPAAIGLVDSSISAPPHGGRWFALPTAKYTPIMSCSIGMRAYSEAGPAWLLARAPTQATPQWRAFVDGELDGARDHEVAHAVVAVDHGAGRALVHDADVGLQVDAAGANALHVLRQAHHAVAVGALQVSAGHQRGDLARIGQRHSNLGKRHRDVGLQPIERDQCRFVVRDHAACRVPKKALGKCSGAARVTAVAASALGRPITPRPGWKETASGIIAGHGDHAENSR